MTTEERNNHLIQFERSLAFMREVCKYRKLDDDDINHLQWITRNLRRLKDYEPSELDWDEGNKEVIVHD